MAKLIRQAGEAAKVKVRQARKIAVDQSKNLASEDDQKRAEKQVCHYSCIVRKCGNCLRCSANQGVVQVQSMTNQFVASIEETCNAKEKELHVL